MIRFVVAEPKANYSLLEYAALATSFAAVSFVLNVTISPFHAAMKPVPVLLQKNGLSILDDISVQSCADFPPQETLHFSRTILGNIVAI